jgi:hypothetical protein
MKIENKNLKTGHLCLICLLCCVLPLEAQRQNPLKMPDPAGKAFPFFMASQALPSDQQLAETAVSLASLPSAGGLNGDGMIVDSERNLLYIPPPGVDGPPLGIPVEEAGAFMCLSLLAYGLFIRKNSSNHTEKTKS